MTLDYYRIFYYVAQYQSFSKAAEILGNNQPNLSRCMNLLESELGCKLLVRTNRGVSLTPEGQRLFEHVAIANEQLMLGEQEILKDKSLESGLVTIGASETALRLFLLNKLELFHHNYPHVRLQISNHSTPQAIRALSHGTVDFSVVTTPIDIKKPLHRTSLLSFREILIGGSSYAAIASRMQSLHDLSEVPFISLGAGTGTRELYSQYFLSHHLVGKHPRPIRFCPWLRTISASASIRKHSPPNRLRAVKCFPSVWSNRSRNVRSVSSGIQAARRASLPGS